MGTIITNTASSPILSGNGPQFKLCILGEPIAKPQGKGPQEIVVNSDVVETVTVVDVTVDDVVCVMVDVVGAQIVVQIRLLYVVKKMPVVWRVLLE